LVLFVGCINCEEIDMTSVTVGSGGNYADWNALITALAAASPLSDHWTVTQISAISAAGYSGLAVIDLNGYDLTIVNGSPHGGDPTAGYITTLTGGSGIGIAGSNGGTFEISGLNVRTTGQQNCSIYATNGTLGLFHDNIFQTNESDPQAQALTIGSYTGSGATVRVWNTIAENGYEDVFYCQNAGSANTVIIENCVAKGGGAGFQGTSTAITFRNCVAFDNSGNDYDGMSAATGVSNASEDGTANSGWSSATGAQTTIVPATEFTSTDITNSNYMKVTSDGVCDDSGATPALSENTTGIRGDARPGTDTNTSIGADELASPPGPGGGGGSSGGGGISGAITAAMAAGY
jgi:hypothetical protein